MRTAWEVKTEDNQTYTVYESSVLKCIKQMISDGFKETDIKSVRRTKAKIPKLK